MLINGSKIHEVVINYKIYEPHILQIGAHLAEEHQIWKTMNASRIDYVEARMDLCELMKNIIEDEKTYIWNYFIGEKNGTTHFFFAYPSYISSSLKLTKEAQIANPNFLMGEEFVVSSLRLETFIMQHLQNKAPDILVLDVQGTESNIISSLGMYSPKIIITELLYADLYLEQSNSWQLVEVLGRLGYSLMIEEFDSSKKWSDALFVLGE